ncbi:glycosyltransferase family 4 protein [candidate division KSB1 bacterium]|nr:glycosyltransferase family 4 protein [candidate division KSB1 bacterium]
MKVLMIAPQPWFSPRGTPLSVLHRLRTLSKLGHQIDFVTYSLGEDIPIPNVTIHRTARVPFVKKIGVGPSKIKIVFDWLIYRKAKELLRKNRYDLIHTHEEAGFFAPGLAKKYQLLHLYDMHSSLPQQLTNFKFTKLGFLISIFRKLEDHTLRTADAVITICPELHNYVQGLFPNKFNMLLENVADNSEVFTEKATSPATLRQKFNLNQHLAIVYAGTFEHYQGIDLLIESSVHIVKQHPAVKFLLVGGNVAQVQKYQAMVAERKVTDNFVFTGSVKPGEVPGYVNLADILVTPRIEGNNTPLKIYDYLRSGKPIVATRHITHTQVLNEQVAILTDLTPAAFAQGVIKLIEDEKLRQRIAQNAAALAEEKYSAAVYVAKTKKVYDYLASKRSK